MSMRARPATIVIPTDGRGTDMLKFLRMLIPITAVLTLWLGLVSAGSAQTGSEPIAELTYISTEGVYLNAGTEIGLQLGDTLEVRRGEKVIATIVINNISSQSAAALIIDKTEDVKPGDLLYALSLVTPKAEAPVPPKPEPVQKRKARRRRGRASHSVCKSKHGLP